VLLKSPFCDNAHREVWARLRYRQKVRGSNGRALPFMRKRSRGGAPGEPPSSGKRRRGACAHHTLMEQLLCSELQSTTRSCAHLSK
jgi:hypothetical protein